jgi:hypothetical protein
MLGFQGKNPLHDDLISLGDGLRDAQLNQLEVQSQQDGLGSTVIGWSVNAKRIFGYSGDAAGRRVRMPNLLCRQH